MRRYAWLELILVSPLGDRGFALDLGRVDTFIMFFSAASSARANAIHIRRLTASSSGERLISTATILPVCQT
jgi:hypothetical protein